MNTEYQYMVDFELPKVFSEDFLELIPAQRERINDFFEERKLKSYALSLEKGKLWAIFAASSEMEVLEWITELPLTKFMKVDISVLSFHNTRPKEVPAFSLN